MSVNKVDPQVAFLRYMRKVPKEDIVVTTQVDFWQKFLHVLCGQLPVKSLLSSLSDDVTIGDITSWRDDKVFVKIPGGTLQLRAISAEAQITLQKLKVPRHPYLYEKFVIPLCWPLRTSKRRWASAAFLVTMVMFSVVV